MAQALLHDPDVLILDEPTDGLDPNQKHEMRTVITAMRPDKAIIISTHLLEEVEAVCSRAIIIAHGRILADGTPGGARRSARAITTPCASASPAARTRMSGPSWRALPGVAAVEPVGDGEGDGLIVFPRGGHPVVGEIADLARTAAGPITGLQVERGRLDDVFREITTAPPEPMAAAA